jgi:hypothetical protein
MNIFILIFALVLFGFLILRRLDRSDEVEHIIHSDHGRRYLKNLELTGIAVQQHDIDRLRQLIAEREEILEKAHQDECDLSLIDYDLKCRLGVNSLQIAERGAANPEHPLGALGRERRSVDHLASESLYELAATIGAHVDRWACAVYGDVLEVARSENPLVEDTVVGLNLLTSLFVLGMVACEQKVGSVLSSRGRFAGACTGKLADVLEKHGAIQPLEIALHSIDATYPNMRDYVFEFGGFAAGASHLIVQCVSRTALRPSDGSIHKMENILSTFVACIQRELV